MGVISGKVGGERAGKVFGMSELDDIIGEIPSNYVVLLEGRPGTGKTSLALMTLCRNVREGRARVLYVTSNECSNKLIKVAKSLGCDLESRIREGKVKVIECPTLGDEYLIEVVTEEIMKNVLEGYDMVIIDSVTPLMKILESYAKKRAWLHTVIYKIASAQNVLVMMVCDKLTEQDPDISLLEYLADVVVSLSYDPDAVFPRRLRILKFRTRFVPTYPIYFDISSRGVRAINAISKSVVERLRSKRKPIRIEDDAPTKLFGKELEPGTQIAIIVKYPASGMGLLYPYLVLRIGLEALRGNVKVGVIYYGRRRGEHILREEGILGELLKDRIVEIPAEVTQKQVPHYLYYSDPELGGIDVLTVTGYEKLIELYGLEEINKMLSIYHVMDSSLGITALRVFRTSPSYPDPPPALNTLSDIVIEVTLNEERECFNLRVVKGRHILRPITILDTELKYVVERLRREFMSAVSTIRRERGESS